MAGRRTGTPDKDVSPMEAQNEGQGRKGSSSDGPLPKTAKSEAGKGEEASGSSVRKGGESESRDDL